MNSLQNINIRPLGVGRLFFRISRQNKLINTCTFSTLQTLRNNDQRESLSRLKVNRTRSNANKNINKLNGNLDVPRWKLGGIIGLLGIAIYGFSKYTKNKLEFDKEVSSNIEYGQKAKLGGAFDLLDQDGKTFTDKDLLGKFSIIYFGFTHCPDICPDQLDKLGVWLHNLKVERKLKEKTGFDIQPIFITCDPDRDSPEVIKKYLNDFDKDIIGLTGTYEQIKQVCKQYRVFFATPEKDSLKTNDQKDYLVDHSAFFYLMDPEGDFVDVLGMAYDEKNGAERIEEHCKYYIPNSKREVKRQKWYGFLFNN
ncbi:hypothetical protein TBLA_0I01780 [Henningerozyma blattae CBS 6284]|uniref:Thioredoxin domain-containing protein n=1 Tax=Henningerozyma blattae (strain ATCC 34711 / CBS 6284 / DSM 70876 / NBRC 10599 / NRRL Y-10934 / UCD 77-7) TaxID=1071380 RepID=I2H8Y4_HENB6|nr:hypothetical protein TBLA_0I01780 [Tetrapisispora blattae CBS 6284]CCH62836.1 hypothetical protein TBLA_0I01780 [Tetrapisispora blattae CBS 6284]